MKNKIRKRDLVFLAVVIFAVINILTVLCLIIKEFKYLHISSLSRSLIFTGLIILPVLIVFVIKHFWSKMKIGTKMISALLVVLISFGSVLPSFLFVYASPIESLTTDISNYLVTEDINRHYIDKAGSIFPQEIPKDAKNKEYYYNYSNCVSPRMDIYASWELTKAYYNSEKDSIFAGFPDAVIQEKDGLGRVYIIDEFGLGSYEYLVFMFNDSTQTIAYAYSYAADTADGTYTPYFWSIED
ncbi:MAG TPA: hypothetical protein VFD52_02620 [Clostridia bacterium]|nr:hypothetical protein [Clostridia bacterium]